MLVSEWKRSQQCTTHSISNRSENEEADSFSVSVWIMLRGEYYFFEKNLSFAKSRPKCLQNHLQECLDHTYQILLSKNRHDLLQVFLTRLKLRTMRWSCMVKSASFSTDNGQTSRFSFFYRINFLTIKFSSQNISITLALTDSALTSRTSRRPYWRKKAPVNDFVRTVPGAKKYCCKWWR